MPTHLGVGPLGEREDVQLAHEGAARLAQQPEGAEVGGDEGEGGDQGEGEGGSRSVQI